MRAVQAQMDFTEFGGQRGSELHQVPCASLSAQTGNFCYWILVFNMHMIFSFRWTRPLLWDSSNCSVCQCLPCRLRRLRWLLARNNRLHCRHRLCATLLRRQPLPSSSAWSEFETIYLNAWITYIFIGTARLAAVRLRWSFEECRCNSEDFRTSQRPTSRHPTYHWQRADSNDYSSISVGTHNQGPHIFQFCIIFHSPLFICLFHLNMLWWVLLFLSFPHVIHVFTISICSFCIPPYIIFNMLINRIIQIYLFVTILHLTNILLLCKPVCLNEFLYYYYLFCFIWR